MSAIVKNDLVAMLNQENGPDGMRAVIFENEDPQNPRNGMLPREYLL